MALTTFSSGTPPPEDLRTGQRPFSPTSYPDFT